MNVIPEAPPVAPTKRRPSKWADAFAVARQHWLTWYRVDTPYAKSSAAQMASDIRCAERRTKNRVAGMLDGEVWDATWGEVDGRYYVWICFIGSNA